MEPVTLPQHVYDAIIAHAREGKPEEVCGVLRGRGLEAFEAIRGRNMAADRINNYEVDPQTLLLQFKFEEADEEMMGIYHSHPITVAYPSATDAWNAHYPESIYFICSLEFDDAPVIRAFRMLTNFMDTQFPDIDVTMLKTHLESPEIRPNANIFAHFQSAEAAVPAILAPIIEKVSPPFYLAMHVDRSENAVDDARVVAVHEHPIAVI